MGLKGLIHFPNHRVEKRLDSSARETHEGPECGAVGAEIDRERVRNPAGMKQLEPTTVGPHISSSGGPDGQRAVGGGEGESAKVEVGKRV